MENLGLYFTKFLYIIIGAILLILVGGFIASVFNGLRIIRSLEEKSSKKKISKEKIWEGLTNSVIQFFGFVIIVISLILIVIITQNKDNKFIGAILGIIFVILYFHSFFLMSGRGIESLQAFISFARESESLEMKISLKGISFILKKPKSKEKEN